MDIQKNIKNNVEDLRCIINEMSTWEKEMKRKENSILKNENADTSDVIHSFLFLCSCHNRSLPFICLYVVGFTTS